jgi:hypothetical protein
MLSSPHLDGSTPSEHHVTALLHAWAGGEESVVRQLTPLVYPELKRLARYHLRSSRPNLSLQPTALVNEVWLRLASQSKLEAKTGAHFLALAIAFFDAWKRWKRSPTKTTPRLASVCNSGSDGIKPSPAFTPGNRRKERKNNPKKVAER